MFTQSQDYSLFFRFLKTYIPQGFKDIDPEDTRLNELEAMMEKNNQFFYIADAIQLKILFTSKRSLEMLGIKPEELSFYHFMQATHCDDIQRLNIGRARLMKTAQDIFIAEKGIALLSTNFKMRNAEGGCTNFLMQNYLFYSSIPYKTVFFLKIHTNIDWYKQIKKGYHYYIGNDLSFFRFPDDEMLGMGNVFTKREFEIIQMISLGLSTDEIAQKLFLSSFTVNTHRRNILNKTGKANLSELIYELRERGLL